VYATRSRVFGCLKPPLTSLDIATSPAPQTCPALLHHTTTQQRNSPTMENHDDGTAIAQSEEMCEPSDVESELSDDISLTTDASYDTLDRYDMLEERRDALYDLRYGFESSYMSGVKRPFQQHALRYERCKPVELKRFVSNRDLKDPYPQGVTLKHFYLRLLERADRHLLFRFMDLPPEMRLLTYRHLLVYPPAHNSRHQPTGRLYPEILRTCKLVLAEAENVLYDDNTFSAFFSVLQGEETTHRIARVHKEMVTGHCGHTKFFRIPHAINDYPQLFTKISKLKIILDYTTEALFDGEVDSFDGEDYLAWPINHALYGLASFLMDGHRLKSLHIELNLPDGLKDRDYEATLHPLRRLRNIESLTTTGSAPPPRLIAKLKSDLQSVEPSFNTLHLWRLLDEEADAQLDLLIALQGNSREDLEFGPSERFEELSFRMNMLYGWPEKCLSARFEEKFLAQMNMLRKCLQEVDTTELKRLVDDLLKKRLAIRAYEEVNDEGR